MDPTGQASKLSEALGARYSPHRYVLVWDGADRGIYRPTNRSQAERAGSDSSASFVGSSVLGYLVIADFGHYRIHRFMHHKYVWRIHKWHHSPTQMYWLAGYRATIPQDVIVNLLYLFAYSLFGLSPWWMELAIGLFNNLQNDWMHINVTWRSNWIEWLIVTPRYHHIHHSDNPSHYMTNLAALFTVWDRLFGTYVNPESVKGELSFGIGEEVPPLRLVLGV